jgi:3-dehydroquinate dehydratase-2
MSSILVIHGPNLNLLGSREPSVYGRESLKQVDARLEALAGDLGAHVTCRQSNAEHEIVAWIQAAPAEDIGAIVINPAAFTHTSVAIRDALQATGIPFIEVHLSNIHAREPFRRHSYLSDAAWGVITGLGPLGYELALHAAIARAGHGSTKNA